MAESASGGSGVCDGRLERVPSLTESEQAFLSDAIFNGEDTTTHVLAGCRSFGGHGGFTGAEMKKLLGPSPEHIVSTYCRLNVEYQPVSPLKPLKPTASLLLSAFADEAREVIAPLVRPRVGGGYGIITATSNNLLLIDSTNGKKALLDTLAYQDMIKILALGADRALIISEKEIRQVLVSGERHLLFDSPCWRSDAADKIQDVALLPKASSGPALLCSTSRGKFAILDADLHPIVLRPYLFGRSAISTLTCNHLEPKQVGCTTINGSVHLLDADDPWINLKFDLPEAANCLTFLGHRHMLVGCTGGMLHLLDIRRPAYPLLTHRDPLVHEVRSLEVRTHDKQVMIAGKSGVVSLWQSARDKDITQSIFHHTIGHIRPIGARVQKAAWVPLRKELVTWDSSRLLRLYEVPSLATCSASRDDYREEILSNLTTGYP